MNIINIMIFKSYDDCGLKLNETSDIFGLQQEFSTHHAQSSLPFNAIDLKKLVSDLLAFRNRLPILIPSTQNVFKMSTKDSSLKQVQRDIERDILVVNGKKVLGSYGFETVIASICATIDEIVSQTRLTPMSSSLKRDFAVSCLREASRTNSGGQSFQALQGLLVPEIVMFPKANLASPLRILLSVGK